MRIYLVQRKHSTQKPRVILAPDGLASTACEMAGLTVETAHCKDITRRTLQPHHLMTSHTRDEVHHD